jgi:hypothetical protein
VAGPVVFSSGANALSVAQAAGLANVSLVAATARARARRSTASICRSNFGTRTGSPRQVGAAGAMKKSPPGMKQAGFAI